MKKTNLPRFIEATKILAKKHSPEILTGIGIAGMITSTLLAVKATPKALILINAQTNGNSPCDHKLKPKEVVKITWKCYIPATTVGVISTICLLGACSAHSKRVAGLAAAYKLSEAALSEYQEKVVEVIGEKKEQMVRDKIAQNHIDEHPAVNREIVVTGGGTTRCYDSISGRYFNSSRDTIEKAANKLSRDLLDEMYISLNDFYYELGIPPTTMGDILGWNVDKGLIDINYSSCLGADGIPCLVLEYRVAPRYDYRDLH